MARFQRFLFSATLATFTPAIEACSWTPSNVPANPLCPEHSRPLQLDGPHSCVENICVYADPAHRKGGGVVVVTTQDNVDRLMAMKLASEPIREGTIAEPLPFHKTDVPGKGVGLVANAIIRKGDYLMADSPTLLVHLQTHGKLGHERQDLRDRLYNAAVQRLPAVTRRAFLRGLMGTGVYDKVETNCFRLFLDSRVDGTGHLGCFPEAARFNHDCRPNLQYHITNMTQSVVAVRDIAPGEELTVSYIELELPRAERQARLRDWGFECACTLCRLDEEASRARDGRVQQIVELRRALDEGDNPAVTANSGVELARLYEAEHLDIHLGPAYTRAALNCALFGDGACAVAYAHRAVEALAIEAGPASADLAAMARLAADPTQHWAWRLRADRAER